MGRLPQLESFDIAAEPDGPPGPSAEWLAGRAAGLAEADAAFAARQDSLRNDLSQTLADMVFSHAAARAHVIASLAPLFRVLVSQVLPALSRTDFAPHLLSLLAEAAARDTAHPISLALHPDQCTALAPVLALLPAASLILRPDNRLGLHEAQITTGEAETALDCDHLLAAATTALSAIFDSSEPARRHHV